MGVSSKIESFLYLYLYKLKTDMTHMSLAQISFDKIMLQGVPRNMTVGE